MGLPPINTRPKIDLSSLPMLEISEPKEAPKKEPSLREGIDLSALNLDKKQAPEGIDLSSLGGYFKQATIPEGPEYQAPPVDPGDESLGATLDRMLAQTTTAIPAAVRGGAELLRKGIVDPLIAPFEGLSPEHGKSLRQTLSQPLLDLEQLAAEKQQGAKELFEKTVKPASSKPITFKSLKDAPIETLHRALNRTIENAPTTIGQLAVTSAAPLLGFGLNAALETGSTAASIDALEAEGVKVNPEYKKTVNTVAGVTKAIPDFFSDKLLLKILGSRAGLLPKFVMTALESFTEGGTEGVQNLIDVVAEQGATLTPEEVKNFGKYVSDTFNLAKINPGAAGAYLGVNAPRRLLGRTPAEQALNLMRTEEATIVGGLAGGLYAAPGLLNTGRKRVTGEQLTPEQVAQLPDGTRKALASGQPVTQPAPKIDLSALGLPSGEPRGLLQEGSASRPAEPREFIAGDEGIRQRMAAEPTIGTGRQVTTQERVIPKRQFEQAVETPVETPVEAPAETTTEQKPQQTVAPKTTVRKPAQKGDGTPTSANFKEATKIAKESFIATKGKPADVQFKEAAAALKAANVHPVIIDEITNPDRFPRPGEPGEKSDATTRRGRYERAVAPSKELQPGLNRITDTASDFNKAKADYEAAKTDLLGILKQRGVEIITADDGVTPKDIRVLKGKTNLSSAAQRVIKDAIQEAAQKGGFSAETVGQGFQMSVTPVKAFPGERLQGSTFAEQLKDFLKKHKAVKNAEATFKRAKNSSFDALVDDYLAKRVAGKEGSAYRGEGKNNQAEIYVRRKLSASDPDIEPFRSQVKALRKKLTSEETQRGADYLTVTKTSGASRVRIAEGKQERITVPKEPAVVREEQPAYTSKKVKQEQLAPIFYSQLERVLDMKLPGSGTPESFLQTVEAFQKKGEFKQEEINWIGLKEWLAEQKGKLTKQQVLDFVRENKVEIEEITKSGDAVKFEQYQTPGGENYREFLLTLPAKEKKPFGHIEKLLNGKFLVTAPTLQSELFNTLEEAEAYTKELGQKFSKSENFESPHFNEPNILAHVRFNERTDADGKRVLFLEEIQSDWHQKGRREGYKNTVAEARIDKIIEEQDRLVDEAVKRHPEIKPTRIGYTTIYDSYWEAEPELYQRYTKLAEDAGKIRQQANFGETLNAPFKTTWHELAFKRMLRYAADNGFDRMAWTTGEQQADRYDLSKQVSSIEISYNKLGKYDVKAFSLTGDNNIYKSDLNETELENTIGKELANKAVNELNTKDEEKSTRNKAIAKAKELGYNSIADLNRAAADDVDGASAAREEVAKIERSVPKRKNKVKYSGLDLKVGGEGMKGFYDKILVDFANKYGKKWGAKTGETYLAPTEDTKLLANDDAEKAAAIGAASVHSIDITPAMRESVRKGGQAMFEKQPPYEPNYKKRPDASEKTDKWAREIVDGLEKGRKQGRVILANAINNQFRNDSTADLIGQDVRTSDDVAVLGQVFRKPTIEVMRYMLVKDGKAVHTTGVTSRLPSSTAIFPYADTAEGLAWLGELMALHKADGYYIIHNHPSGNATASPDDIKQTETIAKGVKGFKGHVIVDSNEYTVIDSSFRPAKQVRNFGEDTLLTPSLDHPVLGTKVDSNEVIADIAKKLQTPKGWATLIGTNKGKVRSIMEVEEGQLSDPKKAAAIARRFATQTGSANIYLHTSDQFWNDNLTTLTKGIKEGFIIDAVSEKGNSADEWLAERTSVFGKERVVKQFGKEAPAGKVVGEASAVTTETIKVDGKERSTRNSDGKLIHPTKEGIENFWRWFSESKIVDEQGRPLVVYHGTRSAGFVEFKGKQRPNEHLSFGFHFAKDKDFAQLYANTLLFRSGDKQDIYNVYLKLSNPLYASQIYYEGSAEFDLAVKFVPKNYRFFTDGGKKVVVLETVIDRVKGQRAQEIIEEAGYDGIIYNAEFAELQVTGRIPLGKSEAYLVFEPTQIKSATDNIGTFSPTEPSIVREEQSPDKETYFIRASEIGNLKRNKTADLFDSFIKNTDRKIIAQKFVSGDLKRVVTNYDGTDYSFYDPDEQDRQAWHKTSPEDQNILLKVADRNKQIKKATTKFRVSDDEKEVIKRNEEAFYLLVSMIEMRHDPLKFFKQADGVEFNIQKKNKPLQQNVQQGLLIEPTATKKEQPILENKLFDHLTKEERAELEASFKESEEAFKNIQGRLDFGLFDSKLQKNFILASKAVLKALSRAAKSSFVKFGDWSKEMVKLYGQKISSYLTPLWNAITPTSLNIGDEVFINGRPIRVKSKLNHHGSNAVNNTQGRAPNHAKRIRNVLFEVVADDYADTVKPLNSALADRMRKIADAYKLFDGRIRHAVNLTELEKKIRDARFNWTKNFFQGDSPTANLETVYFDEHGNGYTALTQIITDPANNTPDNLTELEKDIVKTYRKILDIAKTLHKRFGLVDSELEDIPNKPRVALTYEAKDAIYTTKEAAPLYQAIVNGLAKANRTQDVKSFKLKAEDVIARRIDGEWEVRSTKDREWQEVDDPQAINRLERAWVRDTLETRGIGTFETFPNYVMLDGKPVPITANNVFDALSALSAETAKISALAREFGPHYRQFLTREQELLRDKGLNTKPITDWLDAYFNRRPTPERFIQSRGSLTGSIKRFGRLVDATIKTAVLSASAPLQFPSVLMALHLTDYKPFFKGAADTFRAVVNRKGIAELAAMGAVHREVYNFSIKKGEIFEDMANAIRQTGGRASFLQQGNKFQSYFTAFGMQAFADQLIKQGGKLSRDQVATLVSLDFTADDLKKIRAGEMKKGDSLYSAIVGRSVRYVTGEGLTGGENSRFLRSPMAQLLFPFSRWPVLQMKRFSKEYQIAKKLLRQGDYKTWFNRTARLFGGAVLAGELQFLLGAMLFGTTMKDAWERPDEELWERLMNDLLAGAILGPFSRLAWIALQSEQTAERIAASATFWGNIAYDVVNMLTDSHEFANQTTWEKSARLLRKRLPAMKYIDGFRQNMAVLGLGKANDLEYRALKNLRRKWLEENDLGTSYDRRGYRESTVQFRKIYERLVEGNQDINEILGDVLKVKEQELLDKAIKEGRETRGIDEQDAIRSLKASLRFRKFFVIDGKDMSEAQLAGIKAFVGESRYAQMAAHDKLIDELIDSLGATSRARRRR